MYFGALQCFEDLRLRNSAPVIFKQCIEMKIEITWFLPLILWVLLVTAAACVPPPPAPPAEMSEDEVNTFGLVVGNSNTLVENEWPEQMICAIKA